jgi:hypothetical protein
MEDAWKEEFCWKKRRYDEVDRKIRRQVKDVERTETSPNMAFLSGIHRIDGDGVLKKRR